MADEDALAERIGIGPQLPCHGFVDHGDRNRATAVSVAEQAPAIQADAEHLEVSGRHQIPVGDVEVLPRPTDDVDSQRAALGQRNSSERHRRGPDSG